MKKIYAAEGGDFVKLEMLEIDTEIVRVLWSRIPDLFEWYEKQTFLVYDQQTGTSYSVEFYIYSPEHRMPTEEDDITVFYTEDEKIVEDETIVEKIKEFIIEWVKNNKGKLPDDA